MSYPEDLIDENFLYDTRKDIGMPYDEDQENLNKVLSRVKQIRLPGLGQLRTRIPGSWYGKGATRPLSSPVKAIVTTKSYFWKNLGFFRYIAYIRVMNLATMAGSRIAVHSPILLPISRPFGHQGEIDKDERTLSSRNGNRRVI